MDYSKLLGEVLDDREYAILAIGYPEHGEQATIQVVNSCFAEIFGSQAELLTGLRLSALRNHVERAADWNLLIASVCNLTPLKLDVKVRTDDREIWLGFDLTYKVDARDGASYGFMIGRDITSARRQSIQSDEAQRLLASVFVRTSAPIVLVGADGTILMANPAFHQLLGYTPEETTTLNVSTLTPPEHTEVLTAARALQLQDGKTYELPIKTLTKNGTRVPVRLTSVLLRDTQDVRVVTLLPYVSTKTQPLVSAPPGVGSLAQSSSIGQVLTLSIAAFKTAFGVLWEQRASRAMLLSEQIIKQRLAPADVLIRSDDQSFIVWFDSQNEDRNAAVLDKAARAIRLRLLTEFGGDAAAYIHAVILQVPAATYPADVAGSPGQLRSSPALKDSLLEK